MKSMNDFKEADGLLTNDDTFHLDMYLDFEDSQICDPISYLSGETVNTSQIV